MSEPVAPADPVAPAALVAPVDPVALVAPAAPVAPVAPVVSVILTVTDTQLEYVDECFDSLRVQTHEQLEIIVVTHGRATAVVDVVRRHARQDDRITLHEETLHHENPPSLGAARNTGVERAQGKYVAFADGADRVPARAYEALVESLEESGSDFAVGRLAETAATSRYGRPPRLKVHYRVRQGIDIGDLPTAITDTVVENRLFTRDFWRRCGLTFPDAGSATGGSGGGATGGDAGSSVLALPMVQAYLLGARFDVLARTTYHDMDRGAGVPYGHQADEIQHVAEWLTTQEEIARALRGSREIESAWLVSALDVEARRFLDDTERATPEQWELFSAGLAALLDRMDGDLWHQLRAESRVKVWLAAHGKRTELEDLVSERWYAGGNAPTHVENGTIYAHLPYFGDPTVAIPDDCFTLNTDETPLTSSLRSARWIDDATMELQFFAIIDYLDLSGTTPTVKVWLTPEVGERKVGEPKVGERIELPVSGACDVAVTRFGGHRYQRYDQGVFAVTLNARELARKLGDQPEVSWSIDIEMSAHGATRSGRLSHVDQYGSAAAVAPRRLDGVLVGLHPHSEREVRLTATPAAPVVLTGAVLEGRTLRGTIELSQPQDIQRVRADTPGLKKVTALVTWSGTVGSFELQLPDIGFPGADDQQPIWSLWARIPGKSYPIMWPDRERSSWITGDQDAEIALHRASNGRCEIAEVRYVPAIDRVTVGARTAIIEGRWLGCVPERWTFELGTDRNTVVGRSTSDGQRFTVEFPMTQSLWGQPEMPLPPGGYRLTLHHGDSDSDGDVTKYGVRIGDELAEQLPIEEVTEQHRVRIFRVLDGRLSIRLSGPITDEELGLFAQQRLQDDFTEKSHVLDPSAVYLQSYAGRSATDSQLAIHHELRRTRPDLTLYWGVADRSVVVPEGGVPVLLRSRRWYDVVATSMYVVHNMDFDAWFTKPPGQLFLETFHGYPSKSMGLMLWTDKQYGPRRIATNLRKTRDVWDLILTPTPGMDRYYRSEYCYDGAIHNQGYPRDDILTSPDADRIRAETRAVLGIGDRQTVVLYAPTWRDHLAGKFHATKLTNLLDLESASEALGSEYVLLMRGHRYHARANKRAKSTTRVLDVTDYPEINDLILAADVAVLDYSSLRFDFGLTGKPMIFLVPDLDFYTGAARGFLFDYRSTAPGPLLSTADEVVEAILDLGAHRETYADDIRRFIETYHSWQDGHATERVVQAFFGAGQASMP